MDKNLLGIAFRDNLNHVQPGIYQFCLGEFLNVADNDSIIRIISVVEPAPPMAAKPFAVSYQFYAEVEADMTKKAEETVAQTASNDTRKTKR